MAEHWDHLARDAKWAVLSDPGLKGGRWDDAEFWETGQEDIRRVLDECNRVNASPQRQAVLDFGCGIGRLSAALASQFDRVEGVDVSGSMVAKARILVPLQNVVFHENPSSSLGLFAGNSFDLVLTLITLQHVPPPYNLGYISEFSRVLRRGGIAYFQFASRPKDRMSWRRAKTHVRRALFKVPGAKRVWRAARGELPIEMYGLAEGTVARALSRSGLAVVHRTEDEAAGEDWQSVHYICRKE